ncbi:DUF3592 domain-containing protein [Tunturiibacter lichenicola]|uniref:DUF3592 domain-containing protein n=1 Tax=Tunturiibacter lichenicola TaxID=2051959 RepID=UPI0021B30A46|nr:DUF3592 domain-containing protein [Edaphobacter lichenicola]
MAGIFFIDAIGRWFRRRNRDKKLRLAAQWPLTAAEINDWQILPADQELATTGAPYQIEAGFHFSLNGDYFGGYLRSVALTHREAETRAVGNPTINVRYNPANPDQTAVLAEDNPENLPFRIVSG